MKTKENCIEFLFQFGKMGTGNGQMDCPLVIMAYCLPM